MEAETLSNTLAEINAEGIVNVLIDTLAEERDRHQGAHWPRSRPRHTFADIKAETLSDTPADLKAEALVAALADRPEKWGWKH